ncbi:hypothetical protein EV694_0482 [Volucribacter psittacicida]|uniref:PEGA domain-containing protein n=1 Tax=Volucribacter psittacicida TaxID=203482 RepID=A0A4R1G2L3_9PAST|nr:hypothetical protein [Volucribacter psittacicida]TCK01848.1 hypothetical protein EV694_0482 [Volucribacter psittacicida]
MKNLFKISLLSTVLLTTGCATIVSKHQYPVSINSNPEGIAYSITNRAGEQIAEGVTPDSIELEAGAGYFKAEQYTIEFKKNAKEIQTITLNASLDGWYFGNIIFGGLLGLLVIDPLTGAMYKLPTEAYADFNQQALNILSINDLSDDQKLKLIRLN